jgi:hypothetical protein
MFGDRQYLIDALELTTIPAGRYKRCSSSPLTSYFNSYAVNEHVLGLDTCHRHCLRINTLYRGFQLK